MARLRYHLSRLPICLCCCLWQSWYWQRQCHLVSKQWLRGFLLANVSLSYFPLFGVIFDDRHHQYDKTIQDKQ
ncbi:hypothetical protein [Moraxella lacunata]|uniref:hypothetical protein n=1 Tax=Moraxella lacunata TaxID=477 RepID=UPI003EDF4FB8